jgi:hypothetical protein
MSGYHSARWSIFVICGALTALGCVGTDTDTGQQGETGSLSLDLVIADGIVIDQVGWQITGNGMDMSGDIDVSAPGSTASVEVFGLPPGEENYLVTLAAESADEQVGCRGSAEFNVEIGETTDVMVILNCKLPRRFGSVRVNGEFNICAELIKAVVSPLQTSVGNDRSHHLLVDQRGRLNCRPERDVHDVHLPRGGRPRDHDQCHRQRRVLRHGQLDDSRHVRRRRRRRRRHRW